MTTLDLDALERAARAAAQAHAPFEIKDGPDYAEVIARNGEKVALTVRPELFKLIEQFPALISDYRALQERVEGEEKARDDWQPIETAPKDGTKILVFGPDNNGDSYREVCGWPPNWGGKWPVAYMAYAAGEPTHWRPLPKPPARTKAGEPHEQE